MEPRSILFVTNPNFLFSGIWYTLQTKAGLQFIQLFSLLSTSNFTKVNLSLILSFPLSLLLLFLDWSGILDWMSYSWLSGCFKSNRNQGKTKKIMLLINSVACFLISLWLFWVVLYKFYKIILYIDMSCNETNLGYVWKSFGIVIPALSLHMVFGCRFQKLIPYSLWKLGRWRENLG